MNKTEHSGVHIIEHEYLQNEFTQYSRLLTSVQNNYELIFKTNRDVTKESKKIIYNLQRIPGMTQDEKSVLLSKASKDLMIIRDELMGKITNIMKDDPSFLYASIIPSGMEEFLEAILFFSLLKQKKLLSFNEVRHFLFHTGTNSKEVKSCQYHESNLSKELFGEHVSICREDYWHQIINFQIYVLAMGDVSGETLRYFIKSTIEKDIEASQMALKVLRQMKECYQVLPPSNISNSMKNKIEIHRRNLSKAEQIVCDNNLLVCDMNYYSQHA